MQKKQAVIIPINMQQDTSVSNFKNDSAYEIWNMRIITTGENTSYCLVNEKGNKKIPFNIEFPHNIIGLCVVKDQIVLFTKATRTGSSKPDYIYICKIQNDTIIPELYVNANLGFNLQNPIEAIGIVETNTIKKVYWVDGINQPRLMQIPDIVQDISNTVYKEGYFDFNPTILSISSGIQANILDSGGQFSAGVIQYVASYYNKNKQQSTILEQSPLYYININGRGLSQEGSIKSSVSFEINVYDIPDIYEYIRIYRIYRTSINSVPSVVLLNDIKLKQDSNGDINIKYIDRGTEGEVVDPSSLLYQGGTSFIPSTITHKDNTLFLGNFKTKNIVIPQEIKKLMLVDTDNSSIKYELLSTGISDDKSSLDKDYVYNSNLTKSSDKITHFHYGDYYRFGVQFLSKQGEWSEVLYIGTEKNNTRISPCRYNDDLISTVAAKITFPTKIGNYDFKDNFIAARLCCVYPDEIDREVICQGIVCPTVYNIKDRQDNAPYAQSSWFTRSSLYLSHTIDSQYDEQYNEVLDTGCVQKITKESQLFEGRRVQDNMFSLYTNSQNKDMLLLPAAMYLNGEIYNARGGKLVDSNLEEESPTTRAECIERLKGEFGVDKRVLNLYSPELDTNYNDTISFTKGTKLRIIGYAPVKHSLSDINVQASNLEEPDYSKVLNAKAVEKASSTGFLSKNSLVSGPFWIDRIFDIKQYAPFAIYPWHRNGSLNNRGKTDTERKSVLNKKMMSNLRVCLPTNYFDNFNDVEINNINYEISNVEVFNSDQINSICVLNTNWGINIQYRGNIDKIINVEKSLMYFWKLVSDKSENTQTLNESGYYINFNPKSDALQQQSRVNNDPVPMQYRSTSHAVFALNKDDNDYYQLLPRINKKGIGYTESAEKLNYQYYDYLGLKEEELKSFNGFEQKIIHLNDDVLSSPPYNYSNSYDYYLIGELYKEVTKDTVFGGESENALANNNWIPCSKIYPLSNDSMTITSTQGDTYFQRYDHLTTYSLASNNINQVVDIVSFMVETRINIDGRYDRNRGNSSNLAINPQNFNLFNPVYSQKNNFFQQVYLQADKLQEIEFPNQILWSLNKVLGEDIDTWTNITASNIMDLDGDKGSLNKLCRFNNEIYAFQDKGVSKILFNSRVQLNTTDGVPIEISNSGKVDGKIYIQDNLGCQNKWSIAESPNGIYFVDDITKGIYLFNGQQVQCISDTLNMYSWVNKNSITSIWNLNDTSPIRTLYDRINGDVYFTTDKQALAFNEKLGKFSSLYSYGNVKWLFNYKDEVYQVSNIDGTVGIGDNIWKLHGNNLYCNFFGNQYNYSVSVIANNDFNYDKIFDTVEFLTNGTESFTGFANNKSSDSYPFNTLTTENEYQKAISNISLLKKKFRTWRWQIGRNIKDNFNRDRIRNAWAKITLQGNSTQQVRLYNLIVDYYV